MMALITDCCPDHHFDFHILEWNTKNKEIMRSFGAQHNDIPIHSELLKVSPLPTQQKIDDKLSFIVEEEKMDNLRIANADFITKLIAYIISHQCPRNDISLFEIMKIQKRQRNEYIDDWKPYFECIQEWIRKQIFHKTHLENKSSECMKQFIIFQYAPNDDKTDIHPHQLQNEMDKLLASNDKETIKLLNNLREKQYISSYPDKVGELTKLLNKLENITVNTDNVSTKLPLFVHHFYSTYIEFARNIFHVFSQTIMNLVIPGEVISIITEFAITIDNSMYYDCWYSQQNAKKYDNPLVELWDNLLFKEQHYTLTENNKYNGTVSNIWIPSQYLLKNENDCLQDIVDEIRSNNILHIYRQIIWSILLQINSLNDLYNHDVNHIGNVDDNWLRGCDHINFYDKTLGWNEWKGVRMDNDNYQIMCGAMMYAFGGNIFNSIYALQRMILVHEYDINVGLIDKTLEPFIEKLDNRMKEIFPMIIPNEYELIDALLNATDDPPLIYEFFIDASVFDPLLKCYLIELMLLDGMDALVLTFAAFISLKSMELLQLYTAFAAKDSDEEILKKITKKLFAFKDVKSMSTLYIKYKKEIMHKYGDKIKLKNNPLIIAVDYRQNPP